MRGTAKTRAKAAAPVRVCVPPPEPVLEVDSYRAAGLLGVGVTPFQRIAVLASKRWNIPATGVLTLGVKFLDTTDAGLKSKILAHMNAWADQGCAVRFAESNANATVRIARTRGQGYWSYLGTDLLNIPQSQPTMNLDSFTLNTPEGEYRRVVRHETGHTLGFPHEHMRGVLVSLLDPARTVAYFTRTQGWSAQEVQDQVLTPLSEASLMGTPADQDSVMCYQIPGECTRNGRPIPGGADVNPTDAAFAARLYPGAVSPPPPAPAGQIVIDPAARTVRLPAGWSAVQGA